MVTHIIKYCTLSCILLGYLPTSCGGLLSGLRDRFYRKKPEYTVELMWINQALDPDQQYIHPFEDHKKFKEHIIGWAVNHPKAEVQYLYSSVTTSPDAVKRTQDAIVTENRHIYRRPIVFRDVHSYHKIAKNSDVFSTQVPVYLRADLGRIMVSVATAEATQKPVVYADMDVTPLTEKELFDDQTKKDIDTYGIVMDHNNNGGFENSFHIIAPKKELLMVLKKALIKPTMTYVRGHLNNPAGYKKDLIDPSFVYAMQYKMFWIYYQMMGWGTLTFWNKPYNMDKYGPAKIDRMIARGKVDRGLLFSGVFTPNNSNKKTESPPHKFFYYDKD
jgi:hypothetical protein